MYFDVSEIRNDKIEHDIMRLKQFAERTFMSDYDEDASIEVRFEPLEDEGIDGFCSREEDDSFLIELSPKLRGEDLIRTVIHELVHVKQYLSGKLSQVHRNGEGPRMYWNKMDMTDVLYEERPWECEAHSLEDRLCKQFLSL
jgi:hypothetical protein